MHFDIPLPRLIDNNVTFKPVRTSLGKLLLVTLTMTTVVAFLFWHLAGSVTVIVLGGPHTIKRSKPNIVLIVGDDIGWNDVGYARLRESYRDESPVPFTPNLDRLASDGVKFEDNYVLPTCTPSRAALHTGRYPHRLGVNGIIEMNKPLGIKLDQRFLPEYLKTLAGYDCHMVGKWHLGYCKWKYTPTERGYKSFFGFHGGAEYYYTHNNIVDFKNRKMNGYDFWFDKRVFRSETYSTYEFGNRTVDLIEEARYSEKPFFINLSFQAAHAPLEVPDEYLDSYDDLNIPRDRKRFLAIMTAMDEQVGRIVAALKRTDQWTNTVLIFTSDNGGKPSRGGSNAPLRGTKTTLWEGGTRVPAFIVGKDIPAGKIYNGLFHVTDWLPTILSMTGNDFPTSRRKTSIDGMNHWNSIKNNLPSPREEFVYQINPTTNRMAVRIGEWKLLVGNPGRHNYWYNRPDQIEEGRIWTKDPKEMHLFNIAEDPLEKFNVTAMFPAIVEKLYNRLLEYEAGMAEMSTVEPVARADPARTEGVWMPGWC